MNPKTLIAFFAATFDWLGAYVRERTQHWTQSSSCCETFVDVGTGARSLAGHDNGYDAAVSASIAVSTGLLAMNLCIPRSVTSGQAACIVIKDLRDNPDIFMSETPH
jgi:hypothetical protein